CFVCEGDNDTQPLDNSDFHVCSKCPASFPLDVTHPQTVLTHMGAHILHDSKINRDEQPCGFCGRPFPMCLFVLKKTGDGVAVSLTASKGCPNFVKKFSYSIAAKSGKASPCSNVPLRCPDCDSTDPTVWRYNLRHHLMRYHPLTPLAQYRELWEISDTESAAMLAVWKKIQEPAPKKSRRKKAKPTLAISAAHSSRLALVYVPRLL
ncbi:hypothetical protein GGX14DRAFT_374417, partial [Mycena pura]